MEEAIHITFGLKVALQFILLRLVKNILYDSKKKKKIHRHLWEAKKQVKSMQHAGYSRIGH